MATSIVATYGASDENLLRRIARRDEQAMRALFARYRGRIFRFLMRVVKDEAMAEDVVSDLFLDVWRKAATFREQSTASTWLLAIARNKALTALGRRSEVTLNDEIVSSLVDPAADPERALQDKERNEALGRCVAKLSPEHGEIIDLVYYREKSVREAAQIVGVPEPTVKTRMFYARRRIAELMKAHVTGDVSMDTYGAAA
jgi:RNA polymerase sigma-70 factor (ECF subfamily)